MGVSLEERDTGVALSRQVVVIVEAGGAYAWEGRRVTPEELGTLMREAKMMTPNLMLKVQVEAEEGKPGDATHALDAVYRMADAYGISMPYGIIGGTAE